MIKPSYILVLFGLLVLMAIGFVVIHGDRPDIEAPMDPRKPLITPFDTTTVQSVTIKKTDVTIKMEKKDKTWIMTSLKNRPVKEERLQQLLSNLNMARIESKREGADTNFALDEKGRTLLTIDRGSSKTELIVGKAYEGLKSFVRKDASGPIYEIDKGLDTDAGVRLEKEERVLDPAYFFDLTVLSLASDDVIDVAIKKDHSIVRLQKVVPGKGPVEAKQELGKDDPKPIWWVTEPAGAAADEAAVARITNQLHFTATSYADTVPEKDRGFDKPTAKVKIRLKDGSEKELVFGKVEGTDVFVSVVGNPDPYKIAKYIFDAIVQDAGSLVKKEVDKSKADAAPPTNPNAIPGGLPALPPDGTQLSKEQLEAIKARAQAPIVPPPPPPPEKEDKPALPPAVVKPGDANTPKPDGK